MKQFILGLSLILLGGLSNVFAFPAQNGIPFWLYSHILFDDIIPVLGYYLSIGDILQVLGLALCMFGLFKILNLTQHLPLVNRTSGLDLRYSELQRHLRK